MSCLLLFKGLAYLTSLLAVAYTGVQISGTDVSIGWNGVYTSNHAPSFAQYYSESLAALFKASSLKAAHRESEPFHLMYTNATFAIHDTPSFSYFNAPNVPHSSMTGGSSTNKAAEKIFDEYCEFFSNITLATYNFVHTPANAPGTTPPLQQDTDTSEASPDGSRNNELLLNVLDDSLMLLFNLIFVCMSLVQILSWIVYLVPCLSYGLWMDRIAFYNVHFWLLTINHDVLYWYWAIRVQPREDAKQCCSGVKLGLPENTEGQTTTILITIDHIVTPTLRNSHYNGTIELFPCLRYEAIPYVGGSNEDDCQPQDHETHLERLQRFQRIAARLDAKTKALETIRTEREARITVVEMTIRHELYNRLNARQERTETEEEATHLEERKEVENAYLNRRTQDLRDASAKKEEDMNMLRQEVERLRKEKEDQAADTAVHLGSLQLQVDHLRAAIGEKEAQIEQLEIEHGRLQEDKEEKSASDAKSLQALQVEVERLISLNKDILERLEATTSRVSSQDTIIAPKEEDVAHLDRVINNLKTETACTLATGSIQTDAVTIADSPAQMEAPLIPAQADSAVTGSSKRNNAAAVDTFTPTAQRKSVPPAEQSKASTVSLTIPSAILPLTPAHQADQAHHAQLKIDASMESSKGAARQGGTYALTSNDLHCASTQVSMPSVTSAYKPARSALPRMFIFSNPLR